MLKVPHRNLGPAAIISQLLQVTIIICAWAKSGQKDMFGHNIMNTSSGITKQQTTVDGDHSVVSISNLEVRATGSSHGLQCLSGAQDRHSLDSARLPSGTHESRYPPSSILPPLPNGEPRSNGLPDRAAFAPAQVSLGTVNHQIIRPPALCQPSVDRLASSGVPGRVHLTPARFAQSTKKYSKSPTPLHSLHPTKPISQDYTLLPDREKTDSYQRVDHFSLSSDQTTSLNNPFVDMPPPSTEGFSGSIFNLPARQEKDPFQKFLEGQQRPLFAAHSPFHSQDHYFATSGPSQSSKVKKFG